MSILSFCTRSRDRTGTSVTSLVFETSASTYSAIRANLNQTAKLILFINTFKTGSVQCCFFVNCRAKYYHLFTK